MLKNSPRLSGFPRQLRFMPYERHTDTSLTCTKRHAIPLIGHWIYVFVLCPTCCVSQLCFAWLTHVSYIIPEPSCQLGGSGIQDLQPTEYKIYDQACQAVVEKGANWISQLMGLSSIVKTAYSNPGASNNSCLLQRRLCWMHYLVTWVGMKERHEGSGFVAQWLTPHSTTSC